MDEAGSGLSRRRFLMTLAAAAWLGAACQGRQIAPETTALGEIQMDEDQSFIGVVKSGRFRPLWPPSQLKLPTRLTGIPMQAAQSPESAELRLHEYEGQVIMVTGHDGGGWIYSAAIIDQAGPILTVVVQALFGQERDA